MSTSITGILTVSEIYDTLQKGDTSLYDKRFGFGRENDTNEFSISLEQRNMLPTNPFDLSIEDLCKISKDNEETLDNIIKSRNSDRLVDSRFCEQPSDEDVSLLNDELQMSYEYDVDDESKFDARTNIDITDELTHINMFTSQKWSLLSKFNDNKFISLNKTTLLLNAFTNNRNLARLNRTRRLGELVGLILSAKLRNIKKESRPQLYYVSNGMRPDNTQYHKWNGLQVFDLDLKFAACFERINIDELKEKFHNSLQHYKWYVGIGKSSSGKGLHIYTKVARPHHYWIEESHNESYIKFWYRMSYVQKYAAIRYLMETVFGVDNGEDIKHPVIDFAMAKISQGVRISYDPDFLINPNFEDIQPIVGYHIPPVEGLQLKDWILKDYILNNRIFELWKQQNKEFSDIYNGVSIQPIEQTFEDTSVSLKPGAKPKPFSGNVFYQLRYNVCNTLAAFFGESGREYAHIVLKSEEHKNRGEVNGMYNCSLINKKQPTKFGLEILNSCGFDVVLGSTTKEALTQDTKHELFTLIEKAKVAATLNQEVTLQLESHEYLGMKQSFILDRLKAGKANLIVSPPGTGKTELVKSLSEKYRILLVLPYISVIDAKVIKDNDLGDNFDAYFGDAKVGDIKKGRSAVMTLDKFGRIDVDKIAYMFDYVMIDESHLVFTSSFRLEAMANSLKNIKSLIQMTAFDDYAAKLVMMTGTPTGEIPYFDFYKMLNCINVKKNENRNKSAELIICNNISEAQAKIAIYIAQCLKEGKKVLYPTNNGDVQAAKLIGMIEYQLGRGVKWSYYKKANSNSEMASSINNDATVGDYELILASNYLSVGIDIKDIADFTCVYDGSFAGYEIEQFNCRLRSVDIQSKIFIPIYNNEGDILPNILNYSNFSIRMSREDRDLLRDYVDISKKKLELSITYDPITNRIFTPGFRIENGQIVFKLEEHELVMFEERFVECMRSPYFIASQLAQYGYDVTATDSDTIPEDLVKELIKVGLENAKIESQIKNEQAIYSFNWLMDNNTYINSFGMEVENLVNRIWKENIPIEEDNKIDKIEVVETMIGEVAKIVVPDRRIFDEQMAVASRFLSLYCIDTAKYIYSLCIKKSGKINKAEVSRYMRLMQLVKMEERGHLGSEIYETIKFMYTYLDLFTDKPNYTVSKDEHELRIDYCTQLYLQQLKLDLRSQKMLKKYRIEVAELFNVLCTKTLFESGWHLEFRILPTPDNATKMKLKEYDSILRKMFDISDDRLPKDLQKSIRDRHLTEEEKKSIESVIETRKHGSDFLKDITPY